MTSAPRKSAGSSRNPPTVISTPSQGAQVTWPQLNHAGIPRRHVLLPSERTLRV